MMEGKTKEGEMKESDGMGDQMSSGREGDMGDEGVTGLNKGRNRT